MKFCKTMSLLVVGAVLSLSAATAFASQGPWRFYIKNKQTGTYLTAQGRAHTVEWNHQPVVLAPFNAANPHSQIWNVEPTKEQVSKYFIWNDLAGRVLDVNASTRIVGTHPRSGNGMPSNQVWTIDRGLIQAIGHGCLDAYYINGTWGPTVGTWSCHRANNQIWEFIEVR